MEDAKAAYWNAQEVTDLKMDFDKDFQVGYFGSDALLALVGDRVSAELSKGTDVKTEKFHPLPNKVWRDVIRTSPAEPTISEAVPLEDKVLTSVGGWADPFPATVLKQAGCEQVFFITTQRDSFSLVMDLTNLLGASRSHRGTTYLQSSLKRGLDDADAVWCTNWNYYSDYLSIPAVYDMSDKTFAVNFYKNPASASKGSSFFKDLVTELPVKPRYGCSWMP